MIVPNKEYGYVSARLESLPSCLQMHQKDRYAHLYLIAKVISHHDWTSSQTFCHFHCHYLQQFGMCRMVPDFQLVLVIEKCQNKWQMLQWDLGSLTLSKCLTSYSFTAPPSIDIPKMSPCRSHATDGLPGTRSKPYNKNCQCDTLHVTKTILKNIRISSYLTNIIS